MKAIKFKTIAGLMMLSIVVGLAVAQFTDTPILKAVGISWLAIEGAALLITQFGANRIMFGAGMVLGANVYADTVLLDAQAFIKMDTLKKFQLRRELSQAMNIFEKDREFTIPNLGAIRMSDTQTTTALYLKNKNFTELGTKSCSPTGETSGSSSVAVTWEAVTYALSLNKKQFYGNQVSAEQALAVDLWNLEKTLWKDVDQNAIDYLETNRSGLNNGSSGAFDTTNDIMAIDLVDTDQFYNLVAADMEMNNYNPNYSALSNTAWTANQRYYAAQGEGNSVNTSFQYDGFEFYKSNLISVGVIGSNTYTSIHYIVPDGAVAVLDWNDPLNRAGDENGTQRWFTMQSMMKPQFTFDVFKVKGCADTTTSGGGKQDSTEVWEITFNYAFVKQPLSGAAETGIFKYGIMNDNTFAS